MFVAPANTTQDDLRDISEGQWITVVPLAQWTTVVPLALIQRLTILHNS